MKRASVLAVLFATLVAACGGGGGGSAPAPNAPAPGPAPTPAPPPPAPAPPPGPTAGTWTAPLSTCINPIGGPIEMGGSSLGHIPCLTGTYYATVIRENFQSTGPRIGKSCDLSIAANATFTVDVDGGAVATYQKTVDAVINSVEQSGSFGYGYSAAGSSLAISAIEFWNGESAFVVVDPAHIFTTFVNPAAKVRIEASYKAAGSTTYLVCEG